MPLNEYSPLTQSLSGHETLFSDAVVLSLRNPDEKDNEVLFQFANTGGTTLFSRRPRVRITCIDTVCVRKLTALLTCVSDDGVEVKYEGSTQGFDGRYLGLEVILRLDIDGRGQREMIVATGLVTTLHGFFLRVRDSTSVDIYSQRREAALNPREPNH